MKPTREEILARLRKAREPRFKPPPKGLKHKSDKKLVEEAAEKEARGGDDTDLQKWYKARIKNNAGQCIRCGKKYNKKYEPSAFAAVAHVLDKATFPSVATHPENAIELPADCGCHNAWDNMLNWEERAQEKIWPIVLEKFLIMEPFIQERNRIPEVLFQEIPPKI